MNDFKDKVDSIKNCDDYIKKQMRIGIEELINKIQGVPEIELSIGWGWNKRWVMIGRLSYGKKVIMLTKGRFHGYIHHWFSPSTPEHYKFLRKNWTKIAKKINKHLDRKFRIAWKNAVSMESVIRRRFIFQEQESLENHRE